MVVSRLHLDLLPSPKLGRSARVRGRPPRSRARHTTPRASFNTYTEDKTGFTFNFVISFICTRFDLRSPEQKLFFLPLQKRVNC